MRTKLIPLSRVKPEEKIDSVAESKKLGERRAFDVLMEAQRYWDNMSRFRQDRDRAKRYTYGDQWQDKVCVDGKIMTEEEYIESQGSVPLKNNLIRRLVRTVIGAYRNQMKEPLCTARDRDEQEMGETMSTVLQYNQQMNRMTEVHARSCEEFLISGLVVHKKWYGWRNGKMDCWTDYVQPNNFFIDSNMRDFRGWDCAFVGEIHDVSFQTVVGRFAKNAGDYRRLAEIYKHARSKRYLANCAEQFGYDRLSNYDFLLTSEPTRCRVIEVWRKESKPRYRCHDYNSGEVFKIDVSDYEDMVVRENANRVERGIAAGMNEDDIALIKAEWFVDDYWYYYYLSPFGDILQEGETPYQHGSHPYVFKAYPYIDGEIHSFVADFIDQQRYTNRLITMYDWIMRASAKGVLLFPKDALPDDMSLEDIADEWSRFNGVIAIKTKQGVPLPHQIANNSTNIGITELLNLQLKFFEDISGVQGPLQGRPGFSGMSAALYAQQAQNASTSLLDILDAYGMFKVDAAYKDIKNIQQFYDTKRVYNIAGKHGKLAVYDPKQYHDVEFDIAISENTQSPVYRQLANDFLMQIWQSGQISLEQLLEHGSFEFADELLQSIKAQKEQLEQGQVPEGLSPALQAQAQQGADMNAVNKAYGMLQGQ